MLFRSTRHGPLVTLPYTLECNDIPVMVVQHHESAYWATKCIDCFNQLYEESSRRPKFMAIAIHPYITGQPFRIGYHRAIYDHIASHAGVLHWNGEQVADWYLGQKSKVKGQRSKVKSRDEGV